VYAITAADNAHVLLLLLQFNDICWRGAPHDFKGLDTVFPTGTISFAGGQGHTLHVAVPCMCVGHRGPGAALAYVEGSLGVAAAHANAITQLHIYS
jgi:hypothetical protein